MKKSVIKFLGINFYDWPFLKLIKKFDKGGYLVAPAASSLTDSIIDKNHHFALQKSNIAIFDSGFFCMLLKLRGYFVKKNSGFLFLNNFLNFPEVKNKKLLCIDPSIHDFKINHFFLKKKNFNKIKFYTAPIYPKDTVKDPKLLKLIRQYKPYYILVNIGGGVQEKLALFLLQSINFKLRILCLGAAIGFFTGRQAPINHFWDKMYLGWLIRVFFNPITFIPRIFKSIYLFILVLNKNNFE